MSDLAVNVDGQLALEIPVAQVQGSSNSRRTRTRGPRHPAPAMNTGLSSAIGALQREVQMVEIERGTRAESVMQKALILVEEVHEVLKIMRVSAGVATTVTDRGDLGDELADVLFVSSAIANRLDLRLMDLWSDPKPASDGPVGDVLDAALDISKWSLGVIDDCRHVDAGLSSAKDDAREHLSGLLVAVVRAATAEDIELEAAIGSKLHKDQLRLWE